MAGLLGLFTCFVIHNVREYLVSFYFKQSWMFLPFTCLSTWGHGILSHKSTSVFFFFLRYRSERQCSLSSFRIRHSKNSNQFTWWKWTKGSKINYSNFQVNFFTLKKILILPHENTSQMVANGGGDISLISEILEI